MDEISITYKSNQSTRNDIYNHLCAVDNFFSVPLSARLNIDDYADKLYNYADRLEVWNEKQMIGLVAYYHNTTNNTFHISNVSVEIEFQKKGIAHNLLSKLIEKARDLCVRKINLIANRTMFSFYFRLGFSLGKELSDDNHELEYYVDKKNILVSICCLTYNHEKYIRDCLDGFVNQKTNFNYEILIHDDASTDGTVDIIREYESKYPTIIKPIYQVENQYSKGKSISATYNWSRVAGKYIAQCEGDDYWTDPLKLQKQVDFMEANPEYSMCCNATRWLCSDGKYYDNPNFHGIVDTDITTHQVIERGGLGINLASIVYRNIDTLDRYRKSNWWSRADVGDYPLCIALSLMGKIRYMSDVMSIYRFQHPCSWTERNKNVNIKHLWNEITWMQILDEETERKYHINIEKHLFSFWRTLYREDDQVTTSQYIQKYNEAGKLISIHRLIKDIIRRFVIQIKQLVK